MNSSIFFFLSLPGHSCPLVCCICEATKFGISQRLPSIGITKVQVCRSAPGRDSPKSQSFPTKVHKSVWFSWSFFPHVMQFFLRFCCDSEQLMVYTNIEHATKKCQTNCKLISLFGTLDPSSPWQTWPSHRTHVLPRSPGGLKRRKNPLKKPLWKEKRQRPVRLHSHLHLYIII